MTTLLKKAFDKVSRLPQSEQEAIAALILDEIASEQKWDDLFAKSQDKLSQLADEALEEFKKGKTKPLDL
ncbi:hypothetical protein BMS3Bbin07_00799 [bacterium BMS3Bbin07]|nr:hypothetical protein BMS3Bbin07_00799 [bacterium BMS3Bbin07]